MASNKSTSRKDILEKEIPNKCFNKLPNKWQLPTILNSNVRSVCNKVNEIEVLLKQNHVDVACLSETWLSNDIPDEAVALQGFQLGRNDRAAKRGGGVMCYIRDSIPYKHWSEIECDNFETLWITVRPCRMPREISHIILGVIYHPPGANNYEMSNHIINSLDTITRKHPHAGIMLLGDFNQLKDQTIRKWLKKQQEEKPSWIK